LLRPRSIEDCIMARCEYVPKKASGRAAADAGATRQRRPKPYLTADT
jgi:hypothetical protein